MMWTGISKMALVVALLAAVGAFAVAEEKTVSGICVDESGSPLKGAEVILYYNPFPLGWGELPKELGCGVISRTKTGPDGHFEFPAKLLTYKPGPYTIKISQDIPGNYFLLFKHFEKVLEKFFMIRIFLYLNSYLQKLFLFFLYK